MLVEYCRDATISVPQVRGTESVAQPEQCRIKRKNEFAGPSAHWRVEADRLFVRVSILQVGTPRGQKRPPRWTLILTFSPSGRPRPRFFSILGIRPRERS